MRPLSRRAKNRCLGKPVVYALIEFETGLNGTMCVLNLKLLISSSARTSSFCRVTPVSISSACTLVVGAVKTTVSPLSLGPLSLSLSPSLPPSSLSLSLSLSLHKQS